MAITKKSKQRTSGRPSLFVQRYPRAMKTALLEGVIFLFCLVIVGVMTSEIWALQGKPPAVVFLVIVLSVVVMVGVFIRLLAVLVKKALISTDKDEG